MPSNNNEVVLTRSGGITITHCSVECNRKETQIDENANDHHCLSPCHPHTLLNSSSSSETAEPLAKHLKLIRESSRSPRTTPSCSMEFPVQSYSEFPTLPLELFLEIASYLNKTDLCALRALNKEWRDAIDQDKVWSDLLLRTYGLRECELALGQPAKAQFMRADRVQWSTTKRSPKIDMSNNDLTIRDMCKGDEKFRWVTALSDTVYAAGLHYEEIVVDVCCDSSKNTIKFGFGAVDECTALTHNCPFGYSHGTYTTQDLNSWVYLGDGRIMARNQNTGLCGKAWSRGDRVGIMLDFFNQSLSFYLNGERQIAALPMVCDRVHLAMSLIGGNQVTLIKNPVWPACEEEEVPAVTA